MQRVNAQHGNDYWVHRLEPVPRENGHDSHGHGAKRSRTGRERADPDTPPAELGLAYGELGMLLHAAEHYDVAQPAYRSAESLLPRDPRS